LSPPCSGKITRKDELDRPRCHREFLYRRGILRSAEGKRPRRRNGGLYGVSGQDPLAHRAQRPSEKDLSMGATGPLGDRELFAPTSPRPLLRWARRRFQVRSFGGRQASSGLPFVVRLELAKLGGSVSLEAICHGHKGLVSNHPSHDPLLILPVTPGLGIQSAGATSLLSVPG
jgi:hypothetical protein